MKNYVILALLILGLFVPVVQVFSAIVLFYLTLRGLVIKKTLPILGKIDPNIKVVILISSYVAFLSNITLLMLAGGVILLASALAGLER
jgi:hypothetical protein